MVIEQVTAQFLSHTFRQCGHEHTLAAMAGTAACIMALADERYMGMQLIFLASAGMLLLYVWILVRNLVVLKEKKLDEPEVDDGGFEKVN